MFRVEIPVTCFFYIGPNPFECYRDVWVEMGCLEEAYYNLGADALVHNDTWTGLTLK